MEYGPERDVGIPFSQEEKEEFYRQKATTAMVLSIVGVAVFFIPVGNIAGLVLSIIGLVKSRKSQMYARENGIPECGQNSAAFICGIVGIVLNSLVILLMVFIIAAASWLIVRTVSSTVSPAFSLGEFAVSNAVENLYRMVV